MNEQLHPALRLYELWKAKKGITSDNQAALRLGIKRQTISAWRHTTSKPDTATLRRLAKEAGVPEESYVLATEQERAANSDLADFLKKLANKFPPFAAILFLSLFTVAQSGKACVVNNDAFYINQTHYTYGTLRNWLKGCLEAFWLPPNSCHSTSP